MSFLPIASTEISSIRKCRDRIWIPVTEGFLLPRVNSPLGLDWTRKANLWKAPTSRSWPAAWYLCGTGPELLAKSGCEWQPGLWAAKNQWEGRDGHLNRVIKGKALTLPYGPQWYSEQNQQPSWLCPRDQQPSNTRTLESQREYVCTGVDSLGKALSDLGDAWKGPASSRKPGGSVTIISSAFKISVCSNRF